MMPYSLNGAYPDDSRQVLWEDGERVFCRGWRLGNDGNPRAVLVVVPAGERPSPSSIDRLAHECGLKEELDEAWAVRPLEVVRDGGRTMLILEDPGGEPLDRLLDGPMEVGSFLRLAIGIGKAVGKVHGRDLVHKDIKPANIVVNSATGTVKLTGFGIASRVTRERQSPDPPETIAGTLAYMAPEQTGRMNRPIDSRSDLYSLGITLYRMLTGSLPFTASDPMEWVHCHIARKPVSPAERLPNIPAALSAIVMKLLAKTAEDRYQTAAGLESDLGRCLTQWEAQRRIDDFPLGEHDTPDWLLMPEKLYGRQREVETLLAPFDRIVTGGTPELILISGYSGIGKSSVVDELRKALVSRSGRFASGKFDQYKRDIPYSTLAQAFQSLIRDLLAKSEADLAAWRDALHEALGANGRLMIDLVPELKMIIGEQPPVAELPSQQAQGRFQFVFRRFIGVFARPEHPLALFLDDLQWLDVATLDLLENLLSQPGGERLLVIGAYRDNEVDPTHPLTRKLDAIRKGGAPVHELRLAPLAPEVVEQLIADTLHCEPAHSAPLSQLVHEKTAGNPFFLIQFLRAVAEEGLLTFEHERARWRWDLDRIRAKGYTRNVAELLVGRLSHLPVEVQNALRQLACLGASADETTLSLVLGTSEEQVHADLWDAVRQEFVERSAGAYRFIHDRVQEAAYSLIPETQRAAAHLRIGRLLVARTPPEKREEAIFEIVNHLNRGAALVGEPVEREQLADLMLIAGKRAKASTAYASARAYFTAGAAFLPEDSWKRRHALAFALELGWAECEFLTGALAEAEHRLANLASRALTVPDLAAVAGLREDLFMTLGRSDRAVEVCLEYLRHVDIAWSAHPTKEDVRQEYERIWQQIGSRSIEELLDLPPMTDPKCRATMDVLTKAASPARFTDQNLEYVVIGRMVNLSLEHGNSEASCYAYALVGAVLGLEFGDYSASSRFGKLGLDLVEQRGLDRFEAGVYLVLAIDIIPWTQPIRSGRSLTQRAFEAAERLGDRTFASYSCVIRVFDLIATGDPLGDVQRETEATLDFMRKRKSGVQVDLIAPLLQFIRMMRGLTPIFGSFNDAEFDEGRFERRLEADPRLAVATCIYWVRKLQALVFARDYATALAAAAQAERLLWTSEMYFQFAEYHLYAALARAALCDRACGEERAQYLEALAGHHRQFQKWAANCPENFENRLALIGAEIARLEGREIDAERLYEQAIRSARANGFVHNEAIAYELAARFYEARGFEDFAHVYLRKAHDGYLHWGADGKARQLDELYPYLRTKEPVPAPTSTIQVAVESLDLATVIKVSQVVSGEIDLEKLLETLMRAAIEHAGAERGLLIAPRGHELQIEAEATTSGEDVTVHLPDGAGATAALPESLVRYVARTEESVILDDASTQNPFSADPYIIQRRARSILCLPLINQGKLVAILFLENNLTRNVFTPHRVTVLKLLASQAAMSLENTRLYRDVANREAKIRRLVDANVVGIVIWDLDGSVLEANDAFLHMLGYEREDLGSGRLRWTDFMAAQFSGRDLQEFVAEIQRTGSLQPFEWEYFRKDGSRLPVLNGAALFEGENQGVAFVLDLTERRRAEEALRESEVKFRDYAESASDWLWEIGPDYKFTLLTENAFGSNGADRIGTACWDHALDLETEPEKWRLVWATLEARKPFRDFVYCSMGGNGSPMYVKATGKPVFDAKGEFRGYRGTGTDVTATIRAQEEREKLYRDLAKREAKIRRLVDTNVVGIELWDINGTVLEANDAFLNMIGYEREHLLSGRLRWIDYTAAQFRGRELQEYVAEIQGTGSLPPFEWELIRKDGSRVPVMVGAEKFEGENQGVAFFLDLTERKHVEEALRQSEAYLAEAQRLTHTGSWAYDHVLGKVTHYSDEAYRMFGLDPRRPSGPPQLEESVQLIHPEDRKRVSEEFAQIFRDKTEYEQQYRIVLRDGNVRHVRSNALSVFDQAGALVKYVGTVRDVTERTHAEQRLLAQQRVARILADAATAEEATPRILRAVCECLGWHVGVLWRLDRETGVLRCAELWRTPSLEAAEFEAVTRASTFSPGIGLPGRVWASGAPAYIPDVVLDPNFPRAEIAARQGLQGGFAFPILLGREVLGVIEFFSSDVWRPEEDLLVVLATIGSQIGQFFERKRAENALRLAEAELAHVTRVMTLGELTASIAHEVNQPLGAMVTSAASCARWLAAKPPKMEKATRALERIVNDGRRAGEVIKRIRSLMKRQEPRKSWLDINETIIEVIALAQYQLRRNDISLETQLTQDLSLVQGDKVQLQQLLLNLIVNAIEAMSEIGQRRRELTIVSATDGPDAVRLEVRDTGTGLDPERAAQLFEPFYTTKAEGLGIGLSISRSIVEGHGGRLTAGANAPHGAVFCIWLPVQEQMP